MPRIEVETQLETMTCHRTDCGILFAVPVRWLEGKRRDHSEFSCPNGHGAVFTGKTKEERLQEELNRVRKIAEAERATAARLHGEKQALKRQVSAQKGQVTRLRNKAIRGECAFCHHTFSDVAAHVQEQHPDEAAEAEQEGGE
jgi:hypothetical protein